MTLAEKIYQNIQTLSEPRQAEVLDFVDFLKRKSEQQDSERLEWSRFSLEQAMRGMADEDELYTMDDLKNRD